MREGRLKVGRLAVPGAGRPEAAVAGGDLLCRLPDRLRSRALVRMELLLTELPQHQNQKKNHSPER
jgi:hypothetical protein